VRNNNLPFRSKNTIGDGGAIPQFIVVDMRRHRGGASKIMLACPEGSKNVIVGTPWHSLLTFCQMRNFL